jgi:hypothetical protein
MKNYIVWDVLTRDWWDGNEFSSKPPLVVDASTLAALRQTYKGRKTLLETEVVTLPTITEEEFEALLQRVERLLTNKSFPAPSDEWPAVPWPPF